MRFIAPAAFGLAALAPAGPAEAREVAIDTAVYHERASAGAVRIEPATRLLRGDRVITIVRWDAPEAGRYTATSAVPAALAIESASLRGLEISRDGGRNWQRLADTRRLPRETTHLRWPVRGEGRLTYRAVVR